MNRTTSNAEHILVEPENAGSRVRAPYQQKARDRRGLKRALTLQAHISAEVLRHPSSEKNASNDVYKANRGIP